MAGETGSGKSTQLPKLCLDLGRGTEGMIGHTQPRRVAARTIAERVAEELGSELGSTVGYAVRFTDRVSPATAVKVMTDGLLLAEIRHDRDLRAYDTLIIDEAHERSLNVDFLLGYLKQLLPRRPDLKLIVTSATIDTARFAEHFAGAPVIEVSGRTYPVEVRYRPFGGLVERPGEAEPVLDDRDQVDAIADAVAELWRDGPGDVLVFLSGEREIRDAADALEAQGRWPDLEVLPLYARLSAAEQHRIFQPSRGRRVVLATNVAETSLTVPGVRYVVDTGLARVSRYSTRLKVQRLPIEPVAQASADQRAGRCGRVAPGTCIRLYAEDDFDARPRFTDPEVLRTNLASVVLAMADLGLGEVADFPFLDPPDARAIRDGVALLEELGALAVDGDGDDRADRSSTGPRLTPLGRRLARLPVDPRLGRMVLEADREGCVAEVLVIAAALSIQDPRERPIDKQQAADEAHRRFRVAGSDPLALVELWRYLGDQRRELSSNQFRKRCRAEFLNYLRVREWQDLERQLRAALRSVDIVPGTQPASADQVHRALLAGLLSHIGMRDDEKRDYRGARQIRFELVRASSLSRTPPRWVMAAELVETNRLWGRMAATTRPEWAEAAGAHLLKYSYGDPEWDERSGRAVTTERVTLYGLPLVAGRRVGFDRVDRDEARDLFLHHALVMREWDSNQEFLRANAGLRDEMERMADRVRSWHLLDEDSLFRFYDERVGSGVVSARHFDRWWKQARRDHPDLLTMTWADLAHGAEVDLVGLPDQWRFEDLALPLSYHFDPDSPDDGVTVHVPLALLSRVEHAGFDWHVPGHRREKAQALLRALPKARRREMAPFNEVLTTVADAVRAREPDGRSFVDALADEVRAACGVVLGPNDLDEGDLAPYLRVRISVEDGERVVATGTDVGALRELVGGRVRAAVAAAAPTSERSGIQRWDLGDLPAMVTSEVDGHEVRGYPALLDDGDAAALRVFTQPEIAERIHPSGVRRLLLRSVPVGIRGLERDIPNRVRLALGSLASWPELEGLGVGRLLRDAITAAADQLVAARPPVRSTAAFEALVQAGRVDLRELASQGVVDAGAVLVAAAEVQGRLDRLVAPSLAGLVDDARAHLVRLVAPGFIGRAGIARLGDVERYVLGIGRRLDKLAAEPRRDEIKLQQVLAVEDDHAKLLAALRPSQVTKRVVEVGWQLEELRIATFAESLGAKSPVSAKRITKELDALFAGDLD